MKALTVLLSVVPGIGCYLGLIDGGYGVIEEIKTPAVAGALMSRLTPGYCVAVDRISYRHISVPSGRAPPATPSSSSSESSD